LCAYIDRDTEGVHSTGNQGYGEGCMGPSRVGPSPADQGVGGSVLSSPGDRKQGLVHLELERTHLMTKKFDIFDIFANII